MLVFEDKSPNFKVPNPTHTRTRLGTCFQTREGRKVDSRLPGKSHSNCFPRKVDIMLPEKRNSNCVSRKEDVRLPGNRISNA